MPDAREQNFASLDIALDLLRRPTTVHDRLGILQQLVNFWHSPIRPEDGMSDAEVAGVPLPLPLRWWYRWAGKRAEVMSGQNHLFVPCDLARKYGQLTVKGGRLYFYAENQGVYQWSTLPHGDDPPVFGRYEGRGRWGQEHHAFRASDPDVFVRGRHVPCRLRSFGRVARRGQVRGGCQEHSAAAYPTVAMDWDEVLCRARRIHVRG
jgi:hypothetical protein